jgi:LPXTG-motif cell wall-anchored protein
MKPASVTHNLQQNLKTSPEWRARLNTWGIYAAATGATLAMASNADADTIISGAANVMASVIPNAASAFSAKPFQIGGHSGQIEIGELRVSSFFSISGGLKELGANGLHFATRGSGTLVNFNPGQLILPPAVYFASRGFARNIVSGASGGGNSICCSSGGSIGSSGGPNGVFGSFATGRTGFAGFVLTNGASEPRFGWLRIKVSDPTSVGYMTEIQALDWAYNDTPFAPIAAGETGTPEPATAALALLAAGTAGLLAWRRRRT